MGGGCVDIRPAGRAVVAGSPDVKGWHAGRVMFALARHLDPFACRLMTEFEIDGYRADLVMLSKAGYATEFEVKVSRKDWQAPKERLKLAAPRPHVARFFYVVPAPLYEQGVPAHVPRWAGILVVHEKSWRTHKAPMALYWKCVAVYAGHIARLCR